MQTPARERAVDHAGLDAEREQLAAGDHRPLLSGQPRDLAIRPPRSVEKDPIGRPRLARGSFTPLTDGKDPRGVRAAPIGSFSAGSGGHGPQDPTGIEQNP